MIPTEFRDIKFREFQYAPKNVPFVVELSTKCTLQFNRAMAQARVHSCCLYVRNKQINTHEQSQNKRRHVNPLSLYTFIKLKA